MKVESCLMIYCCVFAPFFPFMHKLSCVEGQCAFAYCRLDMRCQAVDKGWFHMHVWHIFYKKTSVRGRFCQGSGPPPKFFSVWDNSPGVSFILRLWFPFKRTLYTICASHVAVNILWKWLVFVLRLIGVGDWGMGRYKKILAGNMDCSGWVNEQHLGFSCLLQQCLEKAKC